MSVSLSPPRLPLRVRRYGQHPGPDGTIAFLNGYVIVSPGEDDYEIEYTIASYRHHAHGRPMPYAVEDESLLPTIGRQSGPTLGAWDPPRATE